MKLQPKRISPHACLGAAFAALALLSAVTAIAASQIGPMIAAGGHTASLTEREIVVGNDVFRVPANAVRFKEQRRDGVVERLDLYLRWPGLEGYTHETREAFNHAGGAKTLLFLTVEPSTPLQDMSQRLETIYRPLIEAEGSSGPSGLSIHRFRPDSAYRGEVLAVGVRPDGNPFVARCLSAEMAEDTLAPCQRDIFISARSSLTYRFPEALLSEWEALDAAIMAKAALFLQTKD